MIWNKSEKLAKLKKEKIKKYLFDLLSLFKMQIPVLVIITNEKREETEIKGVIMKQDLSVKWRRKKKHNKKKQKQKQNKIIKGGRKIV